MIILTQPKLYLPQHLNCAWYYDSMSISGNGGTLSNFAAVSSITDLSGKGQTLSQGTGANQPQYRTGTVNSNGNSIVLDSASRYLSASNNNYAGEITIFWLGTLDNSAATRRFISYGNNGGVCVGNQTSGGLQAEITVTTVGTAATSSNFFAIGAFALLTVVLRNPSGATWVADFYKNGTAFQTGISAFAPVASSGSFIFGGQTSTTNFWAGQTVMCVGFHRALTTWELNMMHQFFRIRANL